jgi:hypothetical protein
MELTRKTYNARIAEIDFYFTALGLLDNDLPQSSGSSVGPVETYKQDGFLKILKANALLMIYNLVESTVINGVGEI